MERQPIHPIQTLSPITANDSQRSFGIGGQKRCRKTLANLTAYRKEANNNFVYSIFNRPVAFYSATALDGINIRRVNNSDILEISYTSADPGITQKQLVF